MSPKEIKIELALIFCFISDRPPSVRLTVTRADRSVTTICSSDINGLINSFFLLLNWTDTPTTSNEKRDAYSTCVCAGRLRLILKINRKKYFTTTNTWLWPRHRCVLYWSASHQKQAKFFHVDTYTRVDKQLHFSLSTIRRHDQWRPGNNGGRGGAGPGCLLDRVSR